MKMSIVLGVIHMTFALCLQVPNHLKFKRYSDMYTNFIPQIVFLQSIFGYLVLCILYKWSIDWSTASIQPPSLLNMLITMFLQPGSVPPQSQLYRGQGMIQLVLLMTAAICVPWLLIAKPYLLWKEMNRAPSQGYLSLGHDEVLVDDIPQTPGVRLAEEEEGRALIQTDDEEPEHHDFSEVIIHQIIHTIEFCLGCISHTASYLRLWALSLAHAQLSEVLWSMTLEKFLEPTSIIDWIALILVGAFWFGGTLFVLCIMEGLSAFLHALRLHWVEANSKHFEGGGHAFVPLSFASQESKE
jgi:V-type H+-transporting ATPase subunit a